MLHDCGKRRSPSSHILGRLWSGPPSNAALIHAGSIVDAQSTGGILHRALLSPRSVYCPFSAAFRAFTPLSFRSGVSFFGRCEFRRALARATASPRRSEREALLTARLAIPLYVLYDCRRRHQELVLFVRKCSQHSSLMSC